MDEWKSRHVKHALYHHRDHIEEKLVFCFCTQLPNLGKKRGTKTKKKKGKTDYESKAAKCKNCKTNITKNKRKPNFQLK